MPHKALPAGCSHAETGIGLLKLQPIVHEYIRPTPPGMAEVDSAEPIGVGLFRRRLCWHVQSFISGIAKNESTIEAAAVSAVDGSGHLVVNCTRQDSCTA